MTTARRFAGLLPPLLAATRPRQWAKNGIIYFAFIFTVNQSWDPGAPRETLDLLLTSTAAFLLFCLLSGATYLVNDLVDLQADRNHPRKRQRAIPSGRLPVGAAVAGAIVLAATGLALAFLLRPLFGVVAAAYIALTVAYSLGLKRHALVDVMALSGGYILRAVAGAVAIAVPISPWLYVVTGLGALLIGFGKRRNELVLAGDDGGAEGQRPVLRDYSVKVLDQLIAVVAPATLVAYILYSFIAPGLPDDHTMMLTIPMVAYGLFRYLYLVYHRNLGETPEEALLTDRPLLVATGLWLAAALAILAVFR